MNLLVLSDLHIDTCDNFGTFQWDEVDLVMQIVGVAAGKFGLTML
jgi:hypothetical protein